MGRFQASGVRAGYQRTCIGRNSGNKTDPMLHARRQAKSFFPGVAVWSPLKVAVTTPSLCGPRKKRHHRGTPGNLEDVLGSAYCAPIDGLPFWVSINSSRLLSRSMKPAATYAFRTGCFSNRSAFSLQQKLASQIGTDRFKLAAMTACFLNPML